MRRWLTLSRGIVSQEERDEMYDAGVERYKKGEIASDTFSQILADLGYNPTDIEEEIRRVNAEK